MRILGIDYGDRKIGISVSDELGWTAQGVGVIRVRDEEEAMERIGELIREYGISEIVIGLPRNMDASIGPRGELSMRLADTLRQRFRLPVHLWDERLSTAHAERTLIAADMSRSKRKKVVDKLAAVLILQGYLDFRNRGE
jgi:putative Holliday junction resolvase